MGFVIVQLIQEGLRDQAHLSSASENEVGITQKEQNHHVWREKGHVTESPDCLNDPQ